MARVFAYSQEVSHEWRRRATLREFREGLLPLDELCDADFLLKAAARFHGEPSPRPCPICGKELRVVKWVYGDRLGRRAGTARQDDEIEQLVAEFGPISVHFVEVCPHCSWNHLLKEVTATPVM
ncbi:hypothetical protein CAPI_09120 [Corynebacterium capitovis DSM 44611]|uniref:DUF5318 family protein n=1 Tax=Corynebacterium capitovis TaxID=131081 RepID=UPI000366C550|nr:DUF5318 family protein [Corynebacterium capitovis]WKD58347.1 hypothetical protein CAPI_09120 [Corynebacterium capitovis DSM 44611]